MENPELTRTWSSVMEGVLLLLKPLTLAELPVAVQVKSVPETLEVSVTLVDALLQICLSGGVLERSGVGKTVTT